MQQVATEEQTRSLRVAENIVSARWKKEIKYVEAPERGKSEVKRGKE